MSTWQERQQSTNQIQLEFEDHILKNADLEGNTLNRLESFKKELQQSHASKGRTHEELRQAIIADYETIRTDLNQQKRNREDFYEELINKLGAEIMKINNFLSQEKNERLEAHSEFLKTIRVMRDKFVCAIDAENKKRKQDQLDLVKLFEQIATSKYEHCKPQSSNFLYSDLNKSESSQTIRIYFWCKMMWGHSIQFYSSSAFSCVNNSGGLPSTTDGLHPDDNSTKQEVQVAEQDSRIRECRPDDSLCHSQLQLPR